MDLVISLYHLKNDVSCFQINIKFKMLLYVTLFGFIFYLLYLKKDEFDWKPLLLPSSQELMTIAISSFCLCSQIP